MYKIKSKCCAKSPFDQDPISPFLQFSLCEYIGDPVGSITRSRKQTHFTYWKPLDKVKYSEETKLTSVLAFPEFFLYATSS